MHAVTIEEAQAHLPELIAEAQRGGEVVIRGNDLRSVRLEPIEPAPTPDPDAPVPKYDFRKACKEIWGDRVFSDEEVREMREAELGDRS